MRELQFWKGLAYVSLALGAAQLPFSPTRFGGLFFVALAAGSGGEYLMVKAAGRQPVCRVVARVGRVLFGLFLVSFLGVQALILGGMHADEQAAQADYVLVLGARVYENGQPSAALAARLDTARDFLQAHPQARAILCGGQGPNEPCPEAEAMRDYLVARGVPASRLLLEKDSNNTIQNIAGAKALMDGMGTPYRTAVISSDYHMARARRLMAQAGLDPYGVPAPTPYPQQRIAVHCREYGSIMGLLLTGRW